MKINYHNTPSGSSKIDFTLRYIVNIVRTWYLFNLRYSWVKYKGFVRVMAHTKFAKRNIVLGKNVQFGKYCSVTSDLTVGDNVLFASRVCFIDGNDHGINIPCKTIWESPRVERKGIIIEDDVWIGNSCTILGGVTVSKGSVVAAGAVVTKSIPACEVWGGVPACKIKDRFNNNEDKRLHLNYLQSLK